MTDITATNPRTGEKIMLVNGAWTPMDIPGRIETMGRNLAGSIFEGGQNLVSEGVNAMGQAGNDLANPLIRAGNAIRTGDPRQLEAGNKFAPVTPENNIFPNQSPVQDMGNLNPIPTGPLPMSGGDDLLAAAQMAGEQAGEFSAQGRLNPLNNVMQRLGMVDNPEQETSTFQQAQQNQQQISEQANAANPASAAFGDLLGPAVMVTAGRSPAAMANNIREIARQTLASRSGAGFMGGAAKGATTRGNATFGRAMDDLLTKSPVAQFVKTRFPRAIEAGVEGATIALIDNGDPLEVAAWSAGAQASGSIALTALSEIAGAGNLAHKGMRLAGTAAGMAMFLEIAKTIAPGGEDQEFIRTFDSFGSTVTKLTAGMSLGVLSGMAGLGRYNSRQKSVMDAAASFTDAITALPRNTVFSLINEWKKDDRIEPVTKKLMSDPNYFGPAAARRIERAMTTGGSFTEALDKLSESAQFTEKLEAL